MADPVIEKARQVLQTVSDGPMVREVARLRLNAQVTRRLEEAAIRAEMDALRAEAARAVTARTEAEAARTEAEAARARTLRDAIQSLCASFAVPLDDAPREALGVNDAEALQRIFDALVRDRAWPT